MNFDTMNVIHALYSIAHNLRSKLYDFLCTLHDNGQCRRTRK